MQQEYRGAFTYRQVLDIGRFFFLSQNDLGDNVCNKSHVGMKEIDIRCWRQRVQDSNDAMLRCHSL